jgi:uncharacterized membrane protein YdbT with pleckstrin-like domain
MSYFDKNLLPNEQIIFRTKKHYIIFFIPALLLAVALVFSTNNIITQYIGRVFGFVLNNKQSFSLITHIPTLMFTFAALYAGFLQWLTYITSDYVVTNMRILMKEGFFERRLTDTRLSTVAHVTVDQSLLGQILNYGIIYINNFGGSRDAFRLVAKPNQFQQMVQAQLLAKSY